MVLQNTVVPVKMVILT